MDVREAINMVLAPTDMIELPNSYLYTVDMPGIKESDIIVEVEEQKILLISGNRKEGRGKFKTKTMVERRMGKFTRKFNLPENANADKITATYRDGVLRVEVEKVLPPTTRTIIDVNKLPSSSSSLMERKKANPIEVNIKWCTII